jgi:hypothetical protein
MNTEKPKLKVLSEIRFRSMVFLFRMAGIPLQMKKVDYLRYLYGSDFMLFQYNYRHVRRCVHTLGRFGTRHDDNAGFPSFQECYVDIFILQVSNSTGCNKRSIKNVTKLYQIYYRICDLNGTRNTRDVHYLSLTL